MTTPSGPENRPVRPEDLDVTLAVRRDLGPEHDQAVIGEFLDRVGSAIDARVDARVAARPPGPPAPDHQQEKPSIALGIVSVVAAIPISAIVLGTTQGSIAGVLLLIITWVAIVSINVAYNRRR